MKILPLVVFLGVLSMASSVRSQESGQTVSEPVAAPTTPARIIGGIRDGTPQPPAPPKPAYVVPARNILGTTTQEQGGRTITIQKIKPIALPAPPAPAPPAANADNAALADSPADNETGDTGMLMLGATVYRFKDSPSRTLVTYWPGERGKSITLWSSADFSLISGISSFVATDGETRWLFMMWSIEDCDSMADLLAEQDSDPGDPGIPAFADGPATFTIVGTPPADPTVLGPIQSLHDIYNSEYQRLKTAWEGRERARIEREAYLKAHPPKPKDITIRYWNIPAGQAAVLKGEAQP